MSKTFAAFSFGVMMHTFSRMDRCVSSQLAFEGKSFATSVAYLLGLLVNVEMLLITTWLVKGFVTIFAGKFAMFADKVVIQFSNCVEQSGTLNTPK